MKTEDQIRNFAGVQLGFLDNTGNNIETEQFISGVGQLTTFNQLSEKLNCTDFKGISDKPDGWYLPFNSNSTAIVLETKSEKEDLNKWSNEIIKNTKILNKRYSKVIGILYNGQDIKVFKNLDEISSSNRLENKDYYLRLFVEKIDKQKIYQLTKKINDSLHINFGVKNLNHRMIFTACTLIAVKDGAYLYKGIDYNLFHQAILNQLNKSLANSKIRNNKLSLLGDVYSEIKMNIPNNQKAIDDFIEWVKEISELINSDNWNGEDIMAIFFNEFTRYKGKSEAGQVFTPDHITSLIYRLLEVNKDDIVLDAACGSGAFLTKSMCNMIKEAGGVNTAKANEIKAKQLYGIEFDREVYALACANMLIHKDGKTNLEQMDTRSAEAGKWIKDIEVELNSDSKKGVTKVLMNPPFETKYGCLKIVKNVLDNVPVGTLAAFILPDNKLENASGEKLLKKHKLKMIVKLPENLFIKVGVVTSIFIFEAGVPQNNSNIIGYYIEDDGLETVKNQGRQDIKNRWQDIEDYWIQAVQDSNDYKYSTRQIIDPKKHLSYQLTRSSFELYAEDFVKTLTDYEFYKRKIEVKEFNNLLLEKVLYYPEIKIEVKKGEK